MIRKVGDKASSNDEMKGCLENACATTMQCMITNGGCHVCGQQEVD